jgi:cytochrome b561
MKYPLILRFFHWLMAFMILAMIAVGWYMHELAPDSIKYDLYGWHKAFGMLILAFVFVRLLVRFVSKIPALPQGISPIEQKIAKLGHLGLYCLMLFIPIAGYVMSSAAGKDVNFFGLLLPNLIGENEVIKEIAGEVHEILAYSLLALVGLHVLGTLKHRFFDKKENDVLNRML